MATNQFDVYVVLPPELEGINEWDLRAALKQNALSLANQIQARVDARTPVDTGALLADMTHDLDADPDTDLLVRFYADDANQMTVGNRYYAPYQEGPPLGLATYTNPPRHMLYGILEEDLDIIGFWAVDTLEAYAAKLGGTP